jgi:mitochondrial fission protein ELM1
MRPDSSWILTENYTGLQSQALGLTEAAGLAPELRVLSPLGPWRHIPSRFWPRPLESIEPGALSPPLPELIVGCGGKSAAILAALGKRTRTVIVQHPRMNIGRFDLVVAARHDELTGPNVLVTRTALHRVTQARLSAAADAWRERLARLPRPLVAVLVGGSNGRFRLDRPVGEALAVQLAGMMRADRVGVAVTPSRRTAPSVTSVLSKTLTPLGGFVWDLQGENPYFGMLALADAIVVTGDSVSMLSEAAATTAPLMIARLPGRSRRIGLFTQGLIDDARARPYQGRFETWGTVPMNDTPAAAAEMCRRLGY